MLDAIIYNPNTVIVLIAIAVLFGAAAIIFNFIARNSEGKELAALRKQEKKWQLVLPELSDAIDMMYKGRIKDARTKLCRLKNTIS